MMDLVEGSTLARHFAKDEALPRLGPRGLPRGQHCDSTVKLADVNVGGVIFWKFVQFGVYARRPVPTAMGSPGAVQWEDLVEAISRRSEATLWLSVSYLLVSALDREVRNVSQTQDRHRCRVSRGGTVLARERP